MLHRLSQRVRFSVRATDPSAEAADGDIGDEPYQVKIDYGMDRVSNREDVTETPYQGQGTTTYYTTNSVNAYTQIGAEYRTHDDNGNLTCDGTRYFGYDFRNNLVNVLTVASYEFDVFNRRTKKYVNATAATTRCIYDGQSLIEEYDGSDNLIHLFVNGQQIDEPRVMIGPDYADVDGDQNTTEEVRLYFHADQVGSIVAVTGPDETVVEQYEYMPYGAVTIKDGQGTDLNGTSAILNPFMFTARRFDEETGLYHYRHRAYDPVAGRFLQRDPLGYVDGPSLYTYAGGCPTTQTDPLGLRIMLKAGAQGGKVEKELRAIAAKCGLEMKVSDSGEVSFADKKDEDDPASGSPWSEIRSLLIRLQGNFRNHIVIQLGSETRTGKGPGHKHNAARIEIEIYEEAASTEGWDLFWQLLHELLHADSLASGTPTDTSHGPEEKRVMDILNELRRTEGVQQRAGYGYDGLPNWRRPGGYMGTPFWDPEVPGKVNVLDDSGIVTTLPVRVIDNGDGTVRLEPLSPGHKIKLPAELKKEQ